MRILLTFTLGLFAKGNLAQDSLEIGLVDAGNEPSVDILETSTEGSIDNHAVTVHERANGSDISQRHTFAHKESVVEQVSVQGTKSSLEVFLRLVVSLRAKRHVTQNGVNHGGKGRVDFIVAKGDPLLDQGSLLLVFSDKGRVVFGIGDFSEEGGEVWEGGMD